MPASVIFIGDPWDTLDHARDSSLHLARIARDRFGLRCFWARPQNIFHRDGRLYARLEGEVNGNALTPVSAQRELASFHSAHWRADPPVEIDSMRLWSLLACTLSKSFLFINKPQALLRWNEKFAPLRFKKWAIPSLVSNSDHEFKALLNSSHRNVKWIVKPCAEAASRGVSVLPRAPVAALQAIKALREKYGPWVVLQAFDEAVADLGETRVFLLKGAIAGAIRKTPKPGHLVMNFDLSEAARPELSIVSLTRNQKERAAFVAKTLHADGVYLATLDFIGERILEINVTSPGLIRWVDENLPPKKRIATKYWAGLFKT